MGVCSSGSAPDSSVRSQSRVLIKKETSALLNERQLYCYLMCIYLEQLVQLVVDIFKFQSQLVQLNWRPPRDIKQLESNELFIAVNLS